MNDEVQAAETIADERELWDLALAPAQAPIDPRMAAFREFWSAYLMTAIIDYFVARPASSAFKSARDWIFYGCADASGSFETTASILSFDPARLRNAIACRRSELQADPERAMAVLSELRGRAA